MVRYQDNRQRSGQGHILERPPHGSHPRCALITDLSLNDLGQHFLSPDNETKVTLERFSAVLEWFGPFSKGDKLLQNLATIIRIKYVLTGETRPSHEANLRLPLRRGFYGDVSGDQMGIVLAGKPIGTLSPTVSCKPLKN
jgi:hypothetical protein